LDSLMSGSVDIGLVENYVNFREGVNSAFLVYHEVLHIFYREDIEVNSFADLFYNNTAYIGKQESPTFNLMNDLFDYYSLDLNRISVTMNMAEADVVVDLTNLFDDEMLNSYDGFKLYSFEDIDQFGEASQVQGITLKYPRLSAFVIPEGSYHEFTREAVVTLSVDLIMMVRSGLGEIAVNDLTKTMLRNRQIFTVIDPLLYNGMNEDFDQGKLNIPLHEGARIFLDRDEPSFFERYAELGGVILSLVIAVGSGLISLTKWQAQKKKDRIDEFYEDLINIKNKITSLKETKSVVDQIRHVQTSQNKAFELLISEELIANESFRIYMELSKETISELRAKLRALKALKDRAA
ncbi:MAG: TAXI family TRAP transporter solute-binding subunit, partial [Bacteroidota bacterium]